MSDLASGQFVEATVEVASSQDVFALRHIFVSDHGEWPTWLRKASIPVGTCLIIGGVTMFARAHSRRLRRLKRLDVLEKAEARLNDQLVELLAMENMCVEHERITESVRKFSRGLESLAQLWSHNGMELERLFSDVEQDSSSDVGRFFSAWHAVGTSNMSFSSQLSALSASLNEVALDAEMTRAAIRSDANALRQALLEAEAAPEPIAKASGVLAQLVGRVDVELYEKEKQERDFLLRTHWSVTSASIKDLISKLNIDKESVACKISDGVAEARRLTKLEGCRISELPSERDESDEYIIVSPGKGSSEQEMDENCRHVRPMQKKRSSLIDGLIKTLSSPESRQQHLDEEDAGNENAPDNSISSNSEVQVPPLEDIGPSIWRIRNIYEHQVLKMGLRWLDRSWALQDNNQLQHLPGGLFRGRLIGELLSGAISLQSITGNDVAAAQRDLQSLNLPQLLRLRVLHLDFVPSGVGSNSVSAVGGTHEAFLSTLDGLLFRQLGKLALGDAAESLAPQVKTLLPVKPYLDEHRLGREAVLLCAAAAALIVSPWWSWWVTEDRRIFFHASNFTSSIDYPSGDCGVLEVTDFSSGDKHEPTGHLRWFDWRVMLIACEADLSDVPLRGHTTAATGTTKVQGEQQNDDIKGSTATGGATAQMVSPELLQGTRGLLRKTGSNYCGDERHAA